MKEAKRKGLDITCEVAPHHLYFSEEDYSSHGAFIKANPPIRSSFEVSDLKESLLRKEIDCFATDHAPHSKLAKMADY